MDSYFGYLAFPFAFPEIVNIKIPLPLFKALVKIDNILAKVPFVRRFAWHMIIKARKK